jgi:sugar phosphate permease
MAPRPTQVRHQVVGVATLMAVLLYLDRNCLAFAAPYIQEHVRLSDDNLGWLFSAFYLSYALAQVPSGWLADRFGARLMLAAYILIWSLFMGLMGAATGFGVLLLCRLGMGIGQAGAYPTAANIISKWAPFSNRGFASAVVSFGGRVGGSLAPLLTGWLLIWFAPLSVSSLLTSGDLLDAPRLCYQLAPRPTAGGESQAEQASRRVAERLHLLLGPERPAVNRLGAEYARELARLEAAAPASSSAARPAVPLPPSFDREAFRSRLNSLIRQRHALSYVDLAGLPLEKEAVRLRDRNPEELSQPQVERLNRLILEAAFPGTIRRIYGEGWRNLMFVYGAAGIVVAALTWIILRNRPADHPRVNEAELDLIRYGRPAEATATESMARGLPMDRILASRSLWLSCASQFFTNAAWVFLVSWLPIYLERVYRVPLATRAWLVLIPLTVGWAGMLWGGRLTDRLVGALGLRWGRALPMGLTRFLAMAAYLVCLADVPVWVAVAAFSLVAFATDLGVPAVWAFCQDVGGSHAGSVLGWGNMWGNFGAFIAPRFLIWVIQTAPGEYDWDRAFLACAAAFFLSGVAALAIDASKPVVPEEK